MREAVKITDVSREIQNFKAKTKGALAKYAEVLGEGKAKISPVQEAEFASLRIMLADEYEQLISAMQGTDPSKLTDENLAAFWEALFGMNAIKRFPAGGDMEKNLDMFKRISNARIGEFFLDYGLELIGVDERMAGKGGGGPVMVLDIVFIDDGSDKYKVLDFAEEILSFKMEDGGIFVTVYAEDLPKLLARGGRVSAERKAIKKQTGEVFGKNN